MTLPVSTMIGRKAKSKKSKAHQQQVAASAQQEQLATAASSSDYNKLRKRQQDTRHMARQVNNDENDEENIVIDMPEEDDEEDNNFIGGRQEEEEEDLYDTAKLRYQQVAPGGETKRPPTNQRFNVGDLIWFDPNQLGYSIPGKVLDFYPELSVLTVEGCGQPLALEDPQLDAETRNRLLTRADEQLQVYELSEPQMLASIRARKPIGDPLGIEDLVDFEDQLSLETIVWNLKLRFKQDLVYTRCGHKILLSMNPHKQLQHTYNLDRVKAYDSVQQHKLAQLTPAETGGRGGNSKLIRWLTLEDAPPAYTTSKTTSQTLSTITAPPPPAHIFGLANETLKQLLVQCQDQCLVLLGDSGSGKTEAAKLLVQYFATVNKSPTNLMTEQILESIALLESFGNAKTILNDNSSRFGKLLELRFNLTSGFIQEAKTIDLNLLDRSRIVCQNASERNFNVFYELLAGLSRGEKEKYGLQTAEKYFYLNQGHCVALDGALGAKDDAEDFRSLLASMQVLGFNYEEQDTIFRILATILHLGNIYFHRKVLAVRSVGVLLQSQNGTETAGVEGVEIGSDTEARWVSHLLQVQFDLVMRCLTVRTIETPSREASEGHEQAGDSIVSPLNIDQALDTRDAIARALYTCLFRWLVQRINLMIENNKQVAGGGGNVVDQSDHGPSREEPIYLCRTSESLCEFQPDKLMAATSGRNSSSRTGPGAQKNPKILAQQQTATISILDAFGFENLAENNFEQLCVNYAAELLHYHTNRYLVRLERAEYAHERIRWQPEPIDHATGGASLMTPDQFAYGSLNSSNTQIASTSNSIGRHRQAGAIVNLISRKPAGILALLDDECNFPKATDQSFAEKCHHQHALNENYQCARLASTSSSSSSQEFGIRHFRLASRMVWYQVDGFVEKNRDSLRADVMELLLGSKMSIVADMLRKIHQPFGSGGVAAAKGATPTDHHSAGKTLSRTYDGRYVAMKPRAATVAARFQETLTNNRVMECLSAQAATSDTINNNNNNYLAIGQSEPLSSCATGTTTNSHSDSTASTHRNHSRQANTWFIVCLKPNGTKSARVFDVAHVQEQVRAMNLLELAQMRKFGFPVRMRYTEFLKRYRCLVTHEFLAASIESRRASFASSTAGGGGGTVPNSCASLHELCASILEHRLAAPCEQQDSKWLRASYQCGLTKIFLNEKLYHHLELMRVREYQRAILAIQKTWKMWLVRREFLMSRAAAIAIQAHVRAWLAVRHFERQYYLIVALQRRWRRLLHERQRERMEARRQLLRRQQREQLDQLQAQQAKLANQTRFRLVQTLRQHNDKSLDIPEDLAQLYRLQRSWVPIHDLTNLNELDLGELWQREQLRRARTMRSTSVSGKLAVPFIVMPRAEPECQQASPSRELSTHTREFLEQLELDERYSLPKFLGRYFGPQEPQFGYSRLPITRPFSWSRMVRHKRAALRRAQKCCNHLSAAGGEHSPPARHLDSLVAMREESIQRRFLALEQKALAVYKLILRYIDSDQSTTPGPHRGPDQKDRKLEELQEDEAAAGAAMQRLLKFKLISDYINYLCLTEPLLRDEIYLQLASQTWQNPKLRSQENCWKLLLNCLACFEPHLDRRHLMRHLVRYASECCCVRYRAMVCERLVACLSGNQQTTRRFPTTILEYWANQQALGQLAVSVSCYMDDSTAQDPSVEQAAEDNSDEFFNQDETIMSAGRPLSKHELNSAVNYSNKTLAQVSSRTSAEQLARDILEARQVPVDNLTGWSIEIQHEGALSEFSSRLRGDDHLFDHFARLELLPELVQLVDDDLEALECEQLDELGLGAGGVDGSSAEGGTAELLGHAHTGDLEMPDCCPSSSVCGEVPECCQQQQQQVSYGRGSRGRGSELSVERMSAGAAYTQRYSWDFGGQRQSQAELATGALMRSNRSSGQISSRQFHAARPGAYDPYYQHQQQQSRAMNRRSMSMQELQLAASSALNGRYFMHDPHDQGYDAPIHQQQAHYASSCLSGPQFCPPSGGHLRHANRRLSGSLRQLSGGHYQAAPGRRRSATPTSVIGGQYAPMVGATTGSSRFSSSAYGSHSSRTVQNSQTGAGGRQPPVYMSTTSSVDGRHSASYQHNNHRNSAAWQSTYQENQSHEYDPQVVASDQRYGRARTRGGSGMQSAGSQDSTMPRSRRRSASSSSRAPPPLNGRQQAPGSDYASVHSNAYDQIAGSGPRSTRAQASGPQAHQQQQQQQQRRRHLAPLDSYPLSQTEESAASHYAATSSAKSDTGSEAPSMASHVRNVQVPQVNGDLDRYLDDLFNPLLDEFDLGELSDARSMATSIRGTGTEAGSQEAEERGATETSAERGLDETDQQRTQTLSPTFESLLKSLKTPNSSGHSNDSRPQSFSLISTPANLNSLNLSELKALNEKLENEIQAAQSKRASLELISTGSDQQQQMAPPPMPPPQPTFGASRPATTTTSQQLAADIYSRAKTIRIGKWRWPPACDESQPEVTATESAAREEAEDANSELLLQQLQRVSAERKRASVLLDELAGRDQVTASGQASSEPSEPNAPDKSVNEVEALTPAGEQVASSIPVGRLKISSEMKAKLEQLTNSTPVPPEQVVVGAGSSAARHQQPGESLAHHTGPPGRLDAERKNLLANQLLGAPTTGGADKPPAGELETGERPESWQPATGSKVLAVKQQLAAAAGVALSALDSHSGASSQASSRRHSSQIPALIAATSGSAPMASSSTNEVQRRLVLAADELGPQSREAINQRHAFYQGEPALAAEIAAPPPPLPPSVGGNSQKLNLYLHQHKQEIESNRRLTDENYHRQLNSNNNNRQQQWIYSEAGSGQQPPSEPVPGRVARAQTARQAPDVDRPIPTSACLAHANVDWQVRVRKEIFKPSEGYESELVVQLIFAQLVADVFNPRHWTRLNNKERAAIKAIMKDNSIGYAPSLPPVGQMQPIKRELVKMARSFGLYFTRSYQALNFACLTENHLSSGASCAPSDSEGNSTGTQSSASSSSECSDDEVKSQKFDLNSSSSRLALRLARNLNAREQLGTEWIDMVAVHHSGLRLVALVCDQQQEPRPASQAPSDRLSIRNSRQFIANQIGGASGGPPTPPIGYKVLATLKFRDMREVRQLDARNLLVSMRPTSTSSRTGAPRRHNSWLISSSQAYQLASLLGNFLADYNENVRSSHCELAKVGDLQQQERRANGNNKQQTRSEFQASGQPNIKSKKPGKARGARSAGDGERKNALLASDDDHDGHCLAQRQTSAGVHELRAPASANNVLADPKRVLSNHLAAARAPSPSANTARSCDSRPGELDGGRRSTGQSPAAAAAAPAGSNSVSDSPGDRRPSGRKSTGGRREPGGGPDARSGRANNKSPPSAGADCSSASSSRSNTPVASHASNQPPPGGLATTTTTTTTPTTKTREDKNRGSKPSAGGWQNSLSRMSNKFNLFGSVASKSGGASKSGKRAAAANLPNRVAAAADDGQDRSSSSQAAAVALDAWIETKVDFDAEEDEQELHVEQAGEPLGKNPQLVAATATTGETPTGRLAPDSAGSDGDSNNNNNNNQGATVKSSKTDDGKYSMLQFALYNFREAIEKYSLETRLAINHQNGKQQQQHQHEARQPPEADWSTLRGSLKLIESLRNGGGVGGGSSTSQTSPGSNQSTVNSTRALARPSQSEQHSDSGQPTGNDWTWRELAEMVKFTRAPLKRSLLKLGGGQQVMADGQATMVSGQELERRALDCFGAIMRYMGDLDVAAVARDTKLRGPAAAAAGQNRKGVPDNEVECVYLILINCHNFPTLRDEIYCQLIKQTTNNRSERPDSCLRGWRLISLLAAYFECSPNFRPYLVNYLEQNAFDKRRSYHSIALLCLQNLRKTFKFRGRKNVPSIEEIAALSAGRISKRQIYRLPGGTERVINTKSTTVVQDIIWEICTNMLMIEDSNEMLEFSLYCIADGDLYTMPLSRDEYILDITTELIKNHQQYFLIFCRSIWHYPLRLDSKLYIEVTFNQIAPDYLEGLLLVLPRTSEATSSSSSGGVDRKSHAGGSGGGSSHYATGGLARSGGGGRRAPLKLKVALIKEIARLAALLHRASGTDYTPHKDEIKYLLPKPIVAAIKQQLKVAAATTTTGQVNRSEEQQIYAAASSGGTAAVASQQLLELEQQQAADSVMAPNQATWVQLVQSNWREMSAFDTLDAKAQFLDIIRHWPLFGSSFFAIKLIQRDLIQPTDFILALNKFGVQMLDTQTHETHHKYSFNEVISTRKVRSEDGALYLDMKCGTLMKRTIIRIQTDQAHEISRLIRQYIDIELLQANKPTVGVVGPPPGTTARPNDLDRPSELSS